MFVKAIQRWAMTRQRLMMAVNARIDNRQPATKLTSTGEGFSSLPARRLNRQLLLLALPTTVDRLMGLHPMRYIYWLVGRASLNSIIASQ